MINTCLFTRFDLKVQIVEHVGEFRLEISRINTAIKRTCVAAYSVSNDEILAFDGAGLWPRSCRSRFNELGGFAGNLGVFFDSFESDLLNECNQIVLSQLAKHRSSPWTAPNQRSVVQRTRSVEIVRFKP